MREMLYGRQTVLEALRAQRRQFFRLLVADTIQETNIVREILTLAESLQIPVERVPRQHLSRLAPEHHQGTVLEAGEYPYIEVFELLESAFQGTPLVVLADLIQDPQNLGNLLRTADAVGAHGVIIQRRRAASVTPAVVHASAGAAEHVYVAQVTNLADAITMLKRQGIWTIGLEAVKGARLYTETDLKVPLGLVVGSEGRGLRHLVRERCDLLVRIPMSGHVTSLNAAVAGAVVLYEVWRQRHTASERAVQ